MVNKGLTPEQEEQIPYVRDEWIGHALCTRRADREEAELGAYHAYREAGHKLPGHIIWTASPWTGLRAAAALMTDPSCARAMAMASEDNMVAEISDRVSTKSPEVFQNHMRTQFSCALYGQHESEWLAFYDFFGRFCGVQETAKLSGLMRIAKSCGWWWAFDEAVVMSERPRRILMNGSRELHSAEGPALEYPDGFGVHAWNGTRVRPAVTTGAGWGVREIFEARNAEERRCAIERMGWDTFVRDSQMRLVSSAPDPGNPGRELELYDLPAELSTIYQSEARILLCTNGSPEADGSFHRFGLPVPASHDDPVEAAADMYGLSGAEYAKLQYRR